MSLGNWLQNLRSALTPGQPRNRRRSSLQLAKYRPNLEVLEARLTPALQLVAYTGGVEPTPPQLPLSVDVTSDGIPDLIDTNGQNSAIVVRAGQVDGALGNPIYSAAPTGSDLVLADFNNDGRLDLFTVAPPGVAPDAGTQWPTGVVLLGRGDGTFNEEQTIPLLLDSITGMVVVDWGNGQPGVYVSGYDSYDDGSMIAELENDGNWPTLPPPQLPSIIIHDTSVAEHNTGVVNATFSVTLSTASSLSVTVAYSTSDGTASAGIDYRATSGTLTFAPGETSKTLTVPVNGDRLPESDETFVVNLSSPTQATIADGQGVAIIVDDEPKISISDVSKSEGKKNQTTLFTFTVTLSAAYDQPVTMSFKTVDGGAKSSDQDYIAKTGTLTFAPGETTKTITITVYGDSKKESNETFYLDLYSNSSNSQFKKNRGLGTILNDD